jgi:hypothetical protein
MSDAMSVTPVYPLYHHDVFSSLNGLTQKSFEEQ